MYTWLGILVGLICLDRVFVWMERQGWIYWRGTSPMSEPAQPARRRCEDCSYPVSRRALSCPACGRLLRPVWLLLAALIVAALAVGFWRAADVLLVRH